MWWAIDNAVTATLDELGPSHAILAKGLVTHAYEAPTFPQWSRADPHHHARRLGEAKPVGGRVSRAARKR